MKEKKVVSKFFIKTGIRCFKSSIFIVIHLLQKINLEYQFHLCIE